MAEKYSGAHFITKHTVNHDDTSPLTLYIVADGMAIKSVLVEVTETWNDGAKAFEVGDSADPNGFVIDLAANLGTAGYYNLEHDEFGAYIWHNAGSHRRTKMYDGAETIIATFVGLGTGGSQGQCIVYIYHMDIK